jgi:hypothetical protein
MRCRQDVGFAIPRPCKLRAHALCASCSRPVCREHGRTVGDKLLCVTCATARIREQEPDAGHEPEADVNALRPAAPAAKHSPAPGPETPSRVYLVQAYGDPVELRGRRFPDYHYWLYDDALFEAGEDEAGWEDDFEAS